MKWSEHRSRYQACHKLAYFYSAGYGLIHDRVHEAYLKHLEHVRFDGDVPFSLNADLAKKCQLLIAQLIEGGIDDVAFLSNTSLSMNLLALMLSPSGGKGANIVAPEDEFPSSVIPWRHQGFEVKLVPSREGRVGIEDLLAAVDSRTKAVVTSSVQFCTGFRQNLEQLGLALEQRGVPFIVNATQSLGAFPVSVKKSKITALTASGHKWLGAGHTASVLYLNPEFRERVRPPIAGWLSVADPFLMNVKAENLRSDASVLEAGVISYTCLAAMQAALEVVGDIGVDGIAKRILYLATRLERELHKYSIPLMTSRDSVAAIDQSINSGIISIRTDEAEKINLELQKNGIIASPRRGAVRLSVHCYNNEEDIARLMSVLPKFF